MEALRIVSRRKSSAPGAEALAYEVLALLREGAAEVMADILHQCCRDMGDSSMAKSSRERERERERRRCPSPSAMLAERLTQRLEPAACGGMRISSGMGNMAVSTAFVVTSGTHAARGIDWPGSLRPSSSEW